MAGVVWEMVKEGIAVPTGAPMAPVPSEAMRHTAHHNLDSPSRGGTGLMQLVVLHHHRNHQMPSPAVRRTHCCMYNRVLVAKVVAA